MAGVWLVEIAWDALAKDEEYTETFDGAAIGPEWSTVSGTLVTNTGKAQATAASTTAIVDGCANGDVQVTVGTPGAWSLLFRYQDNLNFWQVKTTIGGGYQLVLNTSTIQIIKYTGADVQTAGDVIKVVLVDNSIKLYLNGVLKDTETDSTFQTSRSCGLSMTNDAGRLDNFTTRLHWTDVSGYVRGFQTERGQHETLGRYEAGVLTGLKLNNEDRRFEPLYTASPYYPYVLPGRAVKFVLDGATVWRGNTEEFPVGWEDPYETTIEVTGAGVFEQVANVALESPWFYECQDVDGGKYNRSANRDNTGYPPLSKALGWYRFSGDQYNLTAGNSASSASTGDGTISGGAKQGQSSLVMGDVSGALAFDSQGTGKVVLPAATAPYGAQWSVEFLFQVPQINDAGSIANTYYFIWSQPLKVFYQSHVSPATADDGRLMVQLDNPAGGSLTWKFSVSPLTNFRLDDGTPHHIQIQFGSNLAGDGAVIIDGVSAAPVATVGAAFTGFFASPQAWNLGNSTLGSAPKNGSIDELRTYTGAFWDFLHNVAADFAGHYAAIAQPWLNDPTAARVARVIAYAGQPRTRFVVDQNSASTLDRESAIDGKMLLDYQRALERSEGGPVYEQKDGKVRYASRRARWYDARSTAVQATFGDAAANLLNVDEADFENGIGQWQNAGNATVTQSTDVALVGTHSLKVTATVGGVGSTMFAQIGPGALKDVPALAVVPGTQLTVFASLRAGATARGCRVNVQFYDSSGGYLSAAGSSTVADAVGSWTQMGSVMTVPAGAAWAQMYIAIDNSAVAESHYLDCAMIGDGSLPFTWVPGRNLELDYEKVEIIYTRERVRNSFQGQRLQGNSVRRVNQPSIDQLGERAWEPESDLRNLTDQDVRDRGDALVTRWGYPGQDVQEMTLHPAGGSPVAHGFGSGVGVTGINLGSPAALQVQAIPHAYECRFRYAVGQNVGDDYHFVMGRFAQNSCVFIHTHKLFLYPTIGPVGPNVDDGLWHHMAVNVTPGVAGASALYLDGVRLSTGTVTDTAGTVWALLYDNANESMAGEVSGARVYNRTLTDAEWLARSLGGDITDYATACVLDMPLNEGTGTTAFDNSPSGLTGTYNNTTWAPGPPGSDRVWQVLRSLEIGDLWEVRRTRPDGTRYVKQHYVEYVQFQVDAETGQTYAIVDLSPAEPVWGVAGSGLASNVVGQAVVSW